MAWQLFFEQALNGLQLGVMLFLISGGLTLVLGIMNLLNLTHGSFYAMGAYLGVAVYALTGSFLLALLGAVAGVIIIAGILNLLVMRFLFDRDHLGQVLATFGLLMFLNEMAIVIWGTGALQMPRPAWLAGSVQVLPGLPFPIYRVAITLVGLALVFGLHYANQHTRIGMMIRAGASNRVMLSALGVRIDWLYAFVFGLGAALAALAGVMVAPLMSVDMSMSDQALILCFVVIAIGGLGSVKGAFVASILVGIVDTYGRTFLPLAFGFPLGPALSSMCIYLLMAVVLLGRPQGLFPAGR